MIPPSSGALAVFGADAVKAWEFAAAEVNAKGGVDGHKVELIKSSTDAQPANTVRAARKAVTQDGAKFIGAVMTSPEHGALQQQLAGMNALSINSLGKDDALTGEGCSPNAFRAVQSTSMDINAITATLNELPAKTWAIQAVDYATGHTSAENFKKAAEAAGKKVVLEQYAPLNTTEFGSYITKLKSSGADGLFAVEYGADGVAFVNQGAQFKLFDQFDTVLGFNMVSEPLFETLGDKVVGFYNNLGYDVRPTTRSTRRSSTRGRRRRAARPTTSRPTTTSPPSAVRGRQEGQERRSGQGQGGHERPELRQHRRPGHDGQGPPARAPELRRPGRRGRRRARLEGRRRGRRLQDPSDPRPGLQGVSAPAAAGRALHRDRQPATICPSPAVNKDRRTLAPILGTSEEGYRAVKVDGSHGLPGGSARDRRDGVRR